jgi:hypothetical protein
LNEAMTVQTSGAITMIAQTARLTWAKPDRTFTSRRSVEAGAARRFASRVNSATGTP